MLLLLTTRWHQTLTKIHLRLIWLLLSVNSLYPYRFNASLYLICGKNMNTYSTRECWQRAVTGFQLNHRAIFPHAAVKHEIWSVSICVRLQKALCQYISYHSWLPPQLPLYDTMPFSDSQLLKEMKGADGEWEGSAAKCTGSCNECLAHQKVHPFFL